MTANTSRILIIGGGGIFGSRLCGHLARFPELQIIIAGRNNQSLQRQKKTVETSNLLHGGIPAANPVLCATLNVHQPGSLMSTLAEFKPDVVVHTAGPFQESSYDVAKTCAEARVNYLDLADDRSYVCNFSSLDSLAKKNGVALIGGCSTTPAVTTSVIDAFAHEFDELLDVEIALSPGNKLPRGIATISSVVSYCGKPFTTLQDGIMRTVIGWRGMKEIVFPGVGPRLLSYCNVPDLELLPARYPTLRTVQFRAGMELRVFGYALYLLSVAAPRVDFTRFARPIMAMSTWFQSLGTDDGGMRVDMRGRQADGSHKQVTWSMFAGDGHGPNTPIIPTSVLARLAVQGKLRPGARTSMGEVTLAQFREEVKGYNFSFHTDRHAVQRSIRSAFSDDVVPLLPPFMLRFHVDGARVCGVLNVTRGDSILSNILATLGGLPPAMTEAKTTVHSDGRTWRRRFGQFGMVSHLHYEGGLVMETFNVFGFVPVRFGFHWREQPDMKGFTHTTKRMWVMGVPVPRALMLTADGCTRGHAHDSGWEVEVNVVAPWVGRLVRYQGHVYEDEDNIE